MPFDDWEFTIRWNLHSTFIATKRALPGMIEQGWGRIVNISSVEGKVGKPVVTAYVAAKHAINGFTKAVAREVGETGVTVNSICPGIIITEIVRENGPRTAAAMGLSFDEMIALYTNESAIKRPNTVEEVANVAVMLSSDLGSGITGAVISVDGGTSPY
jgi:NAD(P)-dependent dehydrogenase (short-subunit alcohol dehydrogenase family)